MWVANFEPVEMSAPAVDDETHEIHAWAALRLRIVLADLGCDRPAVAGAVNASQSSAQDGFDGFRSSDSRAVGGCGARMLSRKLRFRFSTRS
jgi:hypothetical protein